MQPAQLWQQVLIELQLQMTKATFTTWLAHTRAISYQDDILTISAPTDFAKDWLENRLLTTIERTLIGIAGPTTTLNIITAEGGSQDDHRPPDLDLPPQPPRENPETENPDLALKFYEFDPTKRGFLQMPKYAESFWQPYLGLLPYALYRFLRSLDKQNEGWGRWHRVSISLIADTIAKGNRQAITGVARTRDDGTEYWQMGALDKLSGANIIRVQRLGSKKRTKYRCSVLNSLPLLTPSQLATLPEALQMQHEMWMAKTSLDYEEWEQLEMDSLVMQD